VRAFMDEAALAGAQTFRSALRSHKSVKKLSSMKIEA
jgi:hypothetical protein